MNAKHIVAKITLTAIAASAIVAASAGIASAGIASADVSEGPYTAKVFPLAPLIFLPGLTAEVGPQLTADVAVHGDILTVAGLTGQITATADGGVATIAGQRIVLTQVAGQDSYWISTEGQSILGQLNAR